VIKNESLKKGYDEINVVDPSGKVLLNIRVATSSRLQRAHLSLKTDEPGLTIERRAIEQPPHANNRPGYGRVSTRATGHDSNQPAR